jgi:hypothetical protein
MVNEANSIKKTSRKALPSPLERSSVTDRIRQVQLRARRQPLRDVFDCTDVVVPDAAAVVPAIA